jgi:hypothetical protein
MKFPTGDTVKIRGEVLPHYVPSDIFKKCNFNCKNKPGTIINLRGGHFLLCFKSTNTCIEERVLHKRTLLTEKTLDLFKNKRFE